MNIILRLLLSIPKLRFLKIYKEAQNVFIPPELHWYFGLWRHEHGLPVWRRGNHVRVTKNYDDYKEQWDWARLVKSEWTEQGKKNHPILSHLIRPTFCLPRWLSFYFFDTDLIYKQKYDDWVAEFNPHLAVVFFGICISVTAVAPKVTDKLTNNTDYWESILTYCDIRDSFMRKLKNRFIEQAKNKLGVWNKTQPAFSKEYLKRNSVVI